MDYFKRRAENAANHGRCSDFTDCGGGDTGLCRALKPGRELPAREAGEDTALVQIELVLVHPVFVLIFFLAVPPSLYMCPWILTAIFASVGFEGWAVGRGYWVQQKGMQKTCIVQTTAMEGKYDHGQPRPVEIDCRIEIYYNPKKPEEFCFSKQKENKSVTHRVPFLYSWGHFLGRLQCFRPNSSGIFNLCR